MKPENNFSKKRLWRGECSKRYGHYKPREFLCAPDLERRE
jgi:hypothetical protein